MSKTSDMAQTLRELRDAASLLNNIANDLANWFLAPWPFEDSLLAETEQEDD